MTKKRDKDIEKEVKEFRGLLESIQLLGAYRYNLECRLV